MQSEKRNSVIDLRKKLESMADAASAPLAAEPRDTKSKSKKKKRSQARRVSPVRVRRRKLKAFLTFAMLIAVAGAVYGIGSVSYMPRYSVTSVVVQGASSTPARLIHAYVESQLYKNSYSFLSKTNIFLYNPGALEREVMGYFPRIKSVTVRRESLLATAVVVTVTERQAYALWCADDAHTDCYEMDDTGFIFAQAPQGGIEQNASSSTYVFTGGLFSAPTTTSAATSTDATSTMVADTSHPVGEQFAGSHLPGMRSLLGLLKDAGYSPMGASVDNYQDFTVPLAGSFAIKASFGEDAHMLVRNLQLVLSAAALQGKQDQLEYIDLRFGDRVYYKLKGQQPQQP